MMSKKYWLCYLIFYFVVNISYSDNYGGVDYKDINMSNLVKSSNLIAVCVPEIISVSSDQNYALYKIKFEKVFYSKLTLNECYVIKSTNRTDSDPVFANGIRQLVFLKSVENKIFKDYTKKQCFSLVDDNMASLKLEFNEPYGYIQIFVEDYKIQSEKEFLKVIENISKIKYVKTEKERKELIVKLKKINNIYSVLLENY